MRDTKTIIATYDHFTIPGDDKPIDSASLSYIHEYKSDALRDAIASLGFETLKYFTVDGL